MDTQQNGWNNFYKQDDSRTRDDWLQHYAAYFARASAVLDLGCGNGSNIPFLLKTGAKIDAVDYAEAAVDFVKQNWNVNAVAADIRNGLPFENGKYDVVLADLSLHYFSFAATKKILQEIFRLTREKGFLICRVNSVAEYNNSAQTGTVVEDNYFELDGNRKRFFDRKMIYDIFDDEFTLVKAEEKHTHKYGAEKNLWEVLAVKLP